MWLLPSPAAGAGSLYSFQEKTEHSNERGIKVRGEGTILTREEQEGQSLVPQAAQHKA